MAAPRLNTNVPRDDGGTGSGLLLSPAGYDDDASSIHTRSEQDTDSDDDELQSRARNSRELRARDRLVLMDEDEIEGLVADSRKKQDRRRRGSGLSVPNPLKMLKRRGSNASMASSVGGDDSGQAQHVRAKEDRRRTRRARRQQRKKQLVEDAEHGEDGRLMYEMESGAIKEGSSTGDSSEREDSDELDRRQLGALARDKAQRGRSWRRWILIHSLIAIGFAMLVLGAWKLSKQQRRKSNTASAAAHQTYVSNGTTMFAPTTIIISLDGFRADFLQRGITPRLNELVAQGVSPKYMLPSFPSVTFPNHYTIATGLYPESHGLVGNTFWDPETRDRFHNTDAPHSLDPKWYRGEPFWVTAENQGIRTAIHMWPGSEADIMGVEPSIVDKFDGTLALDSKVARIFDYLDVPDDDEGTDAEGTTARPQVIAAYVPDVDADGHHYGPNSTEIMATIERADRMVGSVVDGLAQRNLTGIVNVVVVSDHGMATTDTSRLLQLEDLVDTSKIEHIDGWPLSGLRPYDEEADLKTLHEQLVASARDHPGAFDVFLRDTDMSERYHFSQSDRIAPLWLVPRAGWAVVTKAEMDVASAKADGSVYHPRGLHGYDHEHPLMRAIFVARGPAFDLPPNSEVPVFQNIEVYNMLCDSVGIEPRPNNGTLRLPLKSTGLHRPEDYPEAPEDPAIERPTVPAFADPARPTAPPNSNKDSSGKPPPPPPADEKKPPASEDKEQPPPPPPSDEKGQGGGQDGEGDKHKGGFLGGIWGWMTDKVHKVTDKVHEVWDTVAGSG